MESIPNFNADSERLGIKPIILETLYFYLPYNDVFNLFLESASFSDFWDHVDVLPSEISMKLHCMQLEINSSDNSRDFPSDCLQPTLQSFWAANCISQGIHPQSINSRAVSSISDELIETILSEVQEWEKDPNVQGNWKIDDISLRSDDLKLMCEVYANGGMPWIFLDNQELRKSYCAVEILLDKMINNQEFVYKVKKMHEKMKLFEFRNEDLLRNEFINSFGEGNELDLVSFNLSDCLHKGLLGMLKKAKKLLKNLEQPPYLGNIDDSTMKRAESLVQQINLPIHQRSAFNLTPQILQGRLGMPCDHPFEPLSITELLFSDSDGNPYPMPYTNCKNDIPNSIDIPYCKSVLQRFLSRQLLHYGYSSITEQAADILTDFLFQEVKKIAKTYVHSRNASVDASDKECLLHSLEINGYDVDILQNDN